MAVVTGAASGIGLATAHRFAAEGIRLVLADVEADALAAAEAAIKATGVEVLAVQTDVASPEAVDRLADAAFGTFGRVHVVFNNAGVAATAATLRLRAWEETLADWDWTMSINLMGVVHGVRSFVPRMLEGGDEGHIVNTASIAGLATAANPYNVSKHGVVCLTEGIYRDLREMGARLSASVVCPGLINTNILDAERNRTGEFGPRTDVAGDANRGAAVHGRCSQAALRGGYAPDARRRPRARRHPRRPLLHPPGPAEILDMVDVRFTGLLERRNPDPGESQTQPGVCPPRRARMGTAAFGRHEVQGAGMTAGNGTNGANGSGGQLDVDVVVVGAGVAGLYMLHRLRGVGALGDGARDG